MNHIYKVVWSTVTNSLVVVSELARSKGKAASTVSDVKDVSIKTAAITAAAALQVAAISTIAIGSFAPMEANAIVAIGSTTATGISASTVAADGNSTYWTDTGTQAYNYNNPGSLSYENASSKPSSCSTYYSSEYVHGIAIGCNTNVIGPVDGKNYSNGIAIGDYANATGGLSVSLGQLAQSTNIGAMALGTASRASGFNSLAMMRQSAATGDYSVAIGSVAYAKGNASFAMGASATTFGNQSIAIGSVSPTTYAAGNGFEAPRTDYDAVNRTQTNGDRSIALGSGAKTSGNDSFSVGSNATTGSFVTTTSTVNGNETKSQNKADRAIAFGNDSSAKKADAVAFGTKAVANSNSSIAFGGTANATGNSSIAFGINSTTSGNASISIGTNAKAAHDRVITIGTNSTATHNRSMAIGEDAKALANNSLALGSNATVIVENSVSLGNDSNADEIGGQENMTVNGVKYDFAGLKATGTVSVGSGKDNDRNKTTTVRTITDVGAGRVNAQSTDAINGSQLYALVTEIEKGWNVTTDKVDGGIATNSSTAKVINGETVKFIAGKNIAIDQQDQNITVATKDDVTFTNVKTQNLNVEGNTNVTNLTVAPSSTIDMGGNRVTNVGTPTADNDATNKQYVDNGRTQVTSKDGSVTITNSTSNGAKVYDLKVNANVSYTGDSGNGTNKLSDPIKFAGTADEIVTEAKDGEVKFKLADKVKNDIKANADNIAKGFGLEAQDGQTVNKQLGQNISVVGANSNIKTLVEDGKVKIALNNTLNLTNAGSVNIGNTTVNDNGLTINNGPSVTKTGIDAGNTKITNVTNGTLSVNSKEAVNGSQLFETNQNITKLGDTLTAKGLNFVGDNKDEIVHRNLGDTLSIIGGAEQSKLSDNNIGVVGNKDGSLTIKLAKTLNDLTNATFTNSAGNNANTVINGNGVTITPSTGDATKIVSLTDKGLNNGNNTITNVAAGTNPTDAVNVSQLDKVNATANAGWTLQANKDQATESKVKPNQTVSLNNTDGNIIISKSKDDNNVTFGLNNTITVGDKAKGGNPVTIDGSNGTVGGLTNKTFDPNKIVSGQAATEDQLKQVHGDLNTNITNASNDLINKGLSFVGDNSETKVHRKLGETLSVLGGAEQAKLSDNNIGVVGSEGKLEVKLAKELTNLTSANFTSTNTNTTINGNGVTITPAGTDTAKTVSLTDKGLNNGGNNITNVAAGTADTDAVNVSQLKEVSSTANAGWNLTVNGTSSSNVAPKATVDLANKDGNIIITKENNNVTFALNSNLTIGGQDGKDGQIGVKGADGQAGVTLNGKDGSIGLMGPAGANGQPGASANISVANGQPGLDGQPGETKTRIVYNTTTPDGKPVTEEVATLNDGLNFVGNQGDKIAKKLNETLTVKGTLANEAAASSENLRVDSQEGALVVKLAQNLANLTTATFGNTATDKTVVGKDGVTISADNPENTVSLTDKGLNNGNNTITNVSSGLVGNDGTTPVALKDANGTTLTNAVNVGDLKNTVNDLTNATTGGFGLKDATGTEVKQDLGTSIKVTGKDGVNATVVTDGDGKALQISLNSTVTVGNDNEPGVITVKGENGKDGVSINGKDGSIGLNGKDGSNGSITVAQGKPGLDGNDGLNGESKTRIVYNTTTPDGKTTTEEVATLNDGLNFVGDKGAVIAKKLNETLAIKGNLTATADVTDKNLRVDNENGQLIIKMAKVLTDLTSANFTDAAGNNTVIGGNGVTITPQTGDVVSLTSKGLDNGNNTITNVKAGVNGTDAVNVDQLEKVNATANAGWKLTNNGTNASTVTPNATVDLANKDGNIIITKDGNNVTFGFNNDLTVGGPGKDGQNGKDGTIGVKGADGTTGVTLNGKDGSIGLTGAPGKDGKNASANITVAQGAKGLDGNDGLNGESKTRIVYEKPNGDKEEVATLNDGLKFVGDTGEVIAKKLNETLAIKGNLTSTADVTDKNLRVDNEGGQLIIKMAKSLTDLTNATFVSGNSNTTIGGNGLTITPTEGNTVSLTDKGLDNGNNQITNVTSGLADRDGNKVDLANATGDVLNNAVNVGDLKDSVNNLTNATTGGFGLTDENGQDVKADLGKTVTVLGDGSVKTEVVEKDGKKALQIGLTSNVTVGNDKEPGTITVKGEDGKDGVSISGKDGISIKGENGQDAVSISGKDGNGAIAVNGKDGKTGVGLDGANGTIGINGKDGSNGTITVAQGQPGLDGKPGDTKTRIVYNVTAPDGTTVTEEVATLNDGLNFVGNDGKVIAKKLNDTLAIKGNLSSAAEVTANNLRVDNVNGELIIKMAKSLTDLTNATFTNIGGDKSVIEGNGLTITPANGGNTVSLTTKGLDNGGNKVVNVADGDVNPTSTDAVNGSQLYAVSEVANKGWNIQTNGGAVENVKPGDTVNFANGDNIVINNDGKNVTVGLAKDVDLGADGSIKAGDTVMNNDGVKVGDNVSLTKDGLTAGDVKISAETGINAGNKQITNVESGLGGTKLAEAKGDTLKNAANIGDLQTAISGVTDAEQGGGFGLADDNGTEVKQSLGKTIQVKGDGNVKTTVTNGSLTVGLNKDVDLGKDGSLTAGGTKVSDNGVSFADSLVNLTSDGLNNGGNKVTNVKAGDVSATSTDAVNGSQLYATNQNVTNVQNTVAKGWNIEAGTVDGSTGKVTGASKANVAMGDTVGVKAGNNIEITQDGSNIAIATSATPTFDTVTVGKGGNTATVGTVEDQYGSAIKVTGADGKSEIRINNVADGKADNDAVNVRQLKGVAQNVANIDNRVSKLDKRVRGIGANSAAASSLPQVYIPGKSMVAVAGGAYSGASAVAVGYSRASDNGKLILKVNGTANSAGHYSGGVGVGYQW